METTKRQVLDFVPKPEFVGTLPKPYQQVLGAEALGKDVREALAREFDPPATT